MTSLIDFGPLRLFAWVRLLQDLRDLHGRVCPAGTQGMVGRLDLNLLSMVVHLDIQPADAPRIELKIPQAWFIARRGRLTEIFAPVAAPPPPPAPVIATPPPLPALRPVRATPPSPQAHTVSQGEHLDYIFELVRSGQPGHADAHWQALLQAQPITRPGDWHGERRIAEMLAEHAQRLRQRDGRIRDLAAWHWLREMSLSHWYAWGAQATSGGEGSERGRHIRAATKAFDEAEQAHRRAQAGAESG